MAPEKAAGVLLAHCGCPELFAVGSLGGLDRSCRRFGRRAAEVAMTKVIGEFCPYLRASFVHVGEIRSGNRAGWPILITPSSYRDHHRQEVDARLSQAVDDFLLMRGVVAGAQ